MRDTVFIRPATGIRGEFEWLHPGDSGAPVASSRGSLEEAMLECEGRRIIFLAPGDAVLLTTVNIPVRNRQRLHQALPFMLEDRLVQEIEQLHFAIGARAPDGTVSVAVVERAVLDRYLAELRSAGIEPDMIIPQTLALPYAPGAWTTLNDGTMTLVRTAEQSGFAVDANNLDTLLAHTLDEAGANAPAQIAVYGAAEAPEWELLAGSGIEVVHHALPDGALALMARNVREREVIDLLQGEYNRREQLGRMYRPWLPVAFTLGALAMLNIATITYDFIHLSRESGRLQQSIERTYLDAFPEARRVVNPRVQMERGLETLRRGGADTSGFLDMTRDAAALLKQTEGMVLQRISYRDNRLDLALLISDLQSLDGLKQRIADQTGMDVEIQSASAIDNRIDARLQLRMKP